MALAQGRPVVVNTMVQERLAVPPVPDNGHRLWNLFVECGRYSQGFAGPEPLSWTEIDAYDRTAAAFLEPWEARALRDLSIVYCNAWHAVQDEVKATKPKARKDGPRPEGF